MNVLTDKVLWLSDMDGDWLKIRVNNPQALCEQILDGKTYDVEIKQHREKRSMDANAYFHVLCNKIAQKTNERNDVVKKCMVLSYGVVDTFENGGKVGVMLPEGVNVDDYYPYAVWYKSQTVNGKKCDCYLFYKQTHKMNSAEFSHLIDGTIQECKQLGIETLPPDKLRAMLEAIDAQRDKSESNTASGEA